MKNQDKSRLLFGVSLNDRPKWHQFLICSSGFFFGYLVNGVCEVLPVMIMGAFIPGLRRKYPIHEYIPMITTARKAVTLLLSDMIFTKPMTEQQGSGLLLIAMGIIVKMLPSRTAKSLHRVDENQLDKGKPQDEEKRPLV